MTNFLMIDVPAGTEFVALWRGVESRRTTRGECRIVARKIGESFVHVADDGERFTYRASDVAPAPMYEGMRINGHGVPESDRAAQGGAA